MQSLYTVVHEVYVLFQFNVRGCEGQNSYYPARATPHI